MLEKRCIFSTHYELAILLILILSVYGKQKKHLFKISELLLMTLMKPLSPATLGSKDCRHVLCQRLLPSIQPGVDGELEE